MKIKKTLFIIIVCIILLIIIFFPYIKAEFLTLKYGNEFYNLQKQTNVLDEVEYYRVISYSNNIAKVFYVSDSGDLLTFRRGEDGDWKYSDWHTVWSKSGSASNFMWPYYR